MSDTQYGKPNPSSGIAIQIYDLSTGTQTVFAEAAPVLGWDVTNLTWRRIATDTKGQIIISNPGSGGSSGSVIQVIGTDGTATNVGFAAGDLSVPITGVGTDANAGISNSRTIRVVQAAANIINVSQVSLTTAAVIITTSNANRIKLRVTNTGTTPIYIHTTTAVSTATGDLLAGVVGYPWISRYVGALYAIASSGTQVVTVYEESSQ